MKILIAEDDRTSTEFLRKGLTQEGHSVEAVIDGRDAMSYCLYNPCDLLILDRMMPGMDGLSVLKALRAAGRRLPVIFLTAMGDVDDRVEGRPQEASLTTKLTVHDLELDLMSHMARRGGTPIELLAKEYALLEILMRNAGRILTKTMLLEQVWDFNFDPRTTVVEPHMSRLRTKIDKPFDVALIHTTRNSGYSIHAPR